MPEPLEGNAPDPVVDPAPAEDPEETGSTSEDQTGKAIEDARKRQAGAEKARQEAIRERDEAKAAYEALRTGKKSEPKADEFDPEAFKREVQESANKAIEAARLDAKYPTARGRFPEVTDTAKLAELESLFTDNATPETPKPVGNNPARTTSGAKNIEDMTSAELQEQIKKLPREAFGLEPR
ncbi:MAG: hypothetical protein H0W36_02820 [Gemmatimonadetes bacterium]|nr:hypothetical protein [Gemmatimonadota bacterium]